MLLVGYVLAGDRIVNLLRIVRSLIGERYLS